MSHPIDETYGFYNEKTVKARKVHQCDACERPIKVGHYYTRVGWEWDGKCETVKRCGACQTTHKHLQKIGAGDMWPNERLKCGLDYEEEWGNAPPEKIAALPFMSDDEAGQLLAP